MKDVVSHNKKLYQSVKKRVKKTGVRIKQVLGRQLLQDGASPRRQDVCVACHQCVFIAERLMLHGRLHHRTCFRCARCTSQLSLANYYETEKGQYCCETCPDEVVSLHLQQEQQQQQQQPGPDVATPTVTLRPASSGSPRKSVGSRVGQLQKHFMSQMTGGAATSPEQEAVAPAEAGHGGAAVRVDLDVAADRCDSVAVDEDAGRVDDKCSSAVQVAVAAAQAVQHVNDDSSVLECVVEDIKEENVVPDVVNQPQEEEQGVVNPPREKGQDVVNPSQEEGEEVVNPPQEEQEEADLANEEDKRDGEGTGTLAQEQEQEQEQEEAQGDEVDELSQVSDVASAEGETAVVAEIQVSTDVSIDLSTTDADADADTPEKPTRRKSKRNTSSNASKSKTPEEETYPEELNPFDDDPSESSESLDSEQPVQETSKKLLPAPKISLNPFGSDEEDDEQEESKEELGLANKDPPQRPPPLPVKSPPSSTMTTPSPKKRLAPPPPVSSGGSHSGTPTALRRKSAPPPPPQSSSPASLCSLSPIPAPRTIPTPKPRHSSGEDIKSEKDHKDLSNLHKQCGSGVVVNKDTHGQWKRKKGPAPPRPSPQKRQLRKLPLKAIQQELEDIEIKQIELERQGVVLEQNIRSVTEPEDGSAPTPDLLIGIHVEEMILQLFDLVNEKNDLLRRQTELMYTRRQQRLEEEHAELEYQIRCLMEKPGGVKTDEERLREEELIQRLVEVVHRRSEIVDCLEMDRRRQMEEDLSIQQHLDVFNSRGTSPAVEPEDPVPIKSKSKGLKMIQSPMKLIKKDKMKKAKKKMDADKDVDESEAAATAESAPPAQRKDKSKSKSWFAK